MLILSLNVWFVGIRFCSFFLVIDLKSLTQIDIFFLLIFFLILIFGIDFFFKKNWPSRPRDQGQRFWRLKRVDFDFFLDSFIKLIYFQFYHSTFSIFFWIGLRTFFFHFLFCGVILILKSWSRGKRVNSGWLKFFFSLCFFLLFFSVLSLNIFSLRICFVVFFVCLLCYRSQSHDHNHEFQWFIWADFGFLGLFKFFFKFLHLRFIFFKINFHSFFFTFHLHLIFLLN